MKKVYFFVLTCITTAFFIGLAFMSLNKVGAWVDVSAYQTYIDYATDYGAWVLLCLFAFGGLAGKFIKFILGIIIILALVIVAIATFAPQWISSIINGGTKAMATVAAFIA